MSAKLLVEDRQRMYCLHEDEGGNLFLTVVCGGMALFEAKIQLTPDEIERYKKLGKPFVDEMAIQVAKNTEAFKHRMI